MATRRRPTGGTSGANARPRQSHHSIYEDFQPHFELKEEQEAHIVQVHLPGFVKEQARITYVHNQDVIRVHGQRPLDNNKWSRFNQTFPVQQNCDVTKIHGKFSNGILTITIPKKVITRAATAKPVQERPPETAATAGKKSAQEAAAAAATKAEKATFTARDGKEMDDKDGRPPLAPPKGTAAETKAQKDKEDEALQKPISSIQKEKERDEKRLIPLTSPETGIGETKDQKEAKGKADAEPKNAEKVVETNIHKERETGERSTEARALLNILERQENKSRGFGKPKKEDSIAANVMAAAKECMRTLGSGMNDEEKQTLINMGTAVLVLMALGASASYYLWSSGKSKN